MRVIDVAIKYGYNSPDSFSRAFQMLHGVTPSSVKNTEVSLKAYPRITFQIAIKGEIEMKYKFVEKESFNQQLNQKYLQAKKLTYITIGGISSIRENAYSY